MQSDSLKMEILPGLGGRVRSLISGEREFLSGKSEHPDNWGATYWTSPQADWGWPPVAEVDSLPYEVLPESAGLHIRSRVASFGGRSFVIEKHFTAAAAGAIDTEYVIENVGDAAFSMASWEISRVVPNGLTFFPTGAAELTPILPHAELIVDKVAGTSFFDHRRFETGKCRKLHADGRGGYLAHLAGRVLLLKIFEDSTPEEQAPGEGECEIFANDDGKYVEIEVQGAYRSIGSGERSSFVVRTAVVALPTSLSPTDWGGLRNFADEQVARQRS